MPRDSLIDDDMIAYLIEQYKVERYIESSSANGLGVDLVFNEIARNEDVSEKTQNMV